MTLIRENKKSLNRPLLAWSILAIIFILRFGALIWIVENPGRALWPDTGSYLGLAKGMLAGDGYLNVENYKGDLFRTPGYPIFLAILLSVFGENYPAIIAVQLLLAVGTSLFLYGIGQNLGSARAGYLAALIYTLNPNALLWSLLILSETLFALVMTAGLYFLTRLSITWRTRDAILSGAVTGLAILIRPIGLLLLPLWSLWIVLYHWRQNSSLKGSLRIGLVTGIVCLALLLPWMMRNYLVWDQFTLSTVATWNLAQYQAAETLVIAEGYSLEEARRILRTPEARDQKIDLISPSLDIIRRHPAVYFSIHVRGIRQLLTEAGQPVIKQLMGVSSAGSGAFLALLSGNLSEAAARFQIAFADPEDRILVTSSGLLLLFQGAVYVLGLAGAIVLMRAGQAGRYYALLILLTIAVLVLVPGPVASGRFRAVVEPLFALLAGIGVAAITLRLQKTESNSVEELVSPG